MLEVGLGLGNGPVLAVRARRLLRGATRGGVASDAAGLARGSVMAARAELAALRRRLTCGPRHEPAARRERVLGERIGCVAQIRVGLRRDVRDPQVREIRVPEQRDQVLAPVGGSRGDAQQDVEQPLELGWLHAGPE